MHMHNVHRELALKCDICSKSFFTKKGLKDHRRNHKSSEQVEQEINTANGDGVQETNYAESETIDNNQNIHIDEQNNQFGDFIILQNLSEIEGGNVLENVFIVEAAGDSNAGAELLDSNVQLLDLDSIQLNIENYWFMYQNILSGLIVYLPILFNLEI